ncbi:MAG: hypothetical protein Q3979_05560 [Actinomycetaceae bacterium]|nr:hypothetical protein [Actinomycetaceae bacterium]
MTSRADVERYSRVVSTVAEAAVAEVHRIFRGLDLSDHRGARDVLVEAIPRLTAAYGDVSATSAAQWYETVRDRAVGGRYEALLADLEDYVARAAGDVRYAAGRLFTGEIEQAQTLISSSVDKHVKNAGRSTIALNIAADSKGPRWARVPRGPVTCAWCLMLASRGWVYHTQATAGSVGHEYHAHCDCQIVPEWGKVKAHIAGYDPKALYGKYSQARAEVVAQGLTPDAETIAAQIRRLFPNSVTDGVLTRP